MEINAPRSGDDTRGSSMDFDSTCNAQVAGSYAALASLLRGAGRRGEALTYARVALEAKERAFPPGHPEHAVALLALADTLRDHARSAMHVPTHARLCMAWIYG